MRFILFVFLALWFSPAFAWDGQVLSVRDGDSIIIARADTGEKVKIRLYGVDAPELPGKAWQAQAYSKVSRDYLRRLLPVGSKAAVMDMGLDKYSRTLAGIVSLPDGKVVQEEMLQAGLVWVYPQYCKGCVQWTGLQDTARAQKKGLWRAGSPVPPWEWRKGTVNVGKVE